MNRSLYLILIYVISLQARKFRLAFDEEFSKLQKKDAMNELTFRDTKYALRMMGFFFTLGTDHERLVSIKKCFLRCQKLASMSLSFQPNSMLF